MHRATSIITLLAIAVTTSPAAAQERWFRGNTHVHTSNSDGDSPPDVVARWYRDAGYHFVVITDHDQRTPVEPLNDALAVPGEFLVLPGVEVTDRFERRPVHLNGLGVTDAVLPQGGGSVGEVIDRNALAIRAQSGLPQLNHPNGLLRAALTPAEVVASSEVSLFEVCCADWRGGSGVLSTDELWDELLSRDRVFHGVAADDAHRFGERSREPGTAWIMVRAPALTTDAILTSLRQGEFYATTGVILADYAVGSEGLRLELAGADEFGYRTFFIGAGGTVLKRDDTPGPSYAFRGDERYVRVRVERSDGAFAWTQPVFIGASR